MHVRERHENTQREVTFYRYVLEYTWQRNVVYNQRLGVQRVNTASFLLKCMYQQREVRSNVFPCYMY